MEAGISIVIDWPGGIVRRAAHRPSKTPTPFTVKTYSNRSRGMSSVPSFASRRSILNWAASSVLAVGLAPVVATRAPVAVVTITAALRELEAAQGLNRATGGAHAAAWCDGDGMMVSLIQSNYRGMGSGLVPDGLGFMLQDRGQLFSLDPSHANAYAPGKRPFHTIIPAFLMKDGAPVMSYGLMGGAMQPQGHVQILVNMIDFGMNIQEAGDAARFNHQGGRQPTGLDEDLLGTVYVEPGVSEDTIAHLRAMGHTASSTSADTSASAGWDANSWRR